MMSFFAGKWPRSQAFVAWEVAARCILAMICLLAAADAASAGEGRLARQNAASIEPLNEVETGYGEIQTLEGYRLRTIATRPADARGRLPAIYFVQWLSCDTVEIGPSNDGWTQMLRSLVSDSGMVVVRLEKAGVGDSEGGPCVDLDYETELAHHRLALRAAREHRWVDRRRVFVFGASMGANMAPLLAAEAPVRGVAVWGGGAQSWFERQLGFERRSLELRGATGSEIDARMRDLSRFYSALLVDQLSLSEITARNRSLRQMWPSLAGVEGETQFGRPVRFHQQAQARHWAAAWAAIDAPVLAMFGEYDWYEDPAGVQLIGSIANARSPASGEVRIFEGLDHHFMRYRSQADAFVDSGGEPDPTEVMELLLPWLRRHAQ